MDFDQVCIFCWHKMRNEGDCLCPSCRNEYPLEPHKFDKSIPPPSAKALNQAVPAAATAPRPRSPPQQTVVIIMRGIPGCGKVCCRASFFFKNGFRSLFSESEFGLISF
jgi:hypothetical protein